jgi:LacI family transcriptional regulator
MVSVSSLNGVPGADLFARCPDRGFGDTRRLFLYAGEFCLALDFLTIYRQLVIVDAQSGGGSMATGRRRKRSARFIEIALEAGVSASTVDRVLNERGSASDKVRRKVIAAAQRLGVPRILPSAAHELIHIDILLPDNRTPFFLRLRGALAGACSILDKRIVIHRRIFRETNERSLVQAIIKPTYRRRGLIIAAADTQDVRKALEGASDQGEAVVTVVSNVADVPGIAYFGIDNYRAGRTAGFIMGRFARRPGRVMFLSGRNDYAAHQQRTAGCRDALDISFSNLHCDSSSFETLDDDYRCFVAVAEAMRSSDLAGIYNSGAGSAGIKRALEQSDPEHGVTWITHELSDDHRQYLLSGALAMVIDQDPDMQATMALRYLVERLDSNGAKTSPMSKSEFHLYFPENVKEGRYLLADDLSLDQRPAAQSSA